MPTASRLISGLFMLAASTTGAAHASVIALDVGGSNLYSLGNFDAHGSDVEGAVIVAGNLTAVNYSINLKNADAFGSYAMVVGGNLNYTSGAIRNGNVYVGGTTTAVSTGFHDTTTTSILPVVFAAESTRVKGLSISLSGMNATGTTTVQYGGMTITGSASPTTIFNVSGADLASASYFNFGDLSDAQTLIFNVSGTDAIGFNQNGAGLGGFKNYNVLFNFYESTHLNLQSIGMYGSLLAPLATVTGGNGHIDGNVIVGNWNSNMQVNASSYFKPVELRDFPVSVPEPATWLLLVGGLAIIGCLTRRSFGR